jgi:hypothetical protein
MTAILNTSFLFALTAQGDRNHRLYGANQVESMVIVAYAISLSFRSRYDEV